MSRYEGLDTALRAEVVARDGNRCRWCGNTGTTGQCAAHHIRYRRGAVDDVAGNLILLCFECHRYVHDSFRIAKAMAQRILYLLIETPGVTGRELHRRIQRSDLTALLGGINDSTLVRRDRRA